MKIAQRFILSVLVFLAPMGILFYFDLEQVSADIGIASLEMDGNAYQRPLVGMLIAAGEHQLYKKLSDADAAKWSPEMAKSKQQVETFLAQLRQANAVRGARLKLTGEALKADGLSDLSPSALQLKWEALEKAAHAPYGKELEDRYRDLIRNIRAAISHAADTSTLTFDPEMDSYYVMDVTAFAMPQMLNRIVAARSYIHPLLDRGLTDEERTEAAIIARELREFDFDRINADMDKALKENARNPHGSSATLKTDIDGPAARFRSASAAFIGLIGDIAGNKPVSAGDFRAAALAATASAAGLWEKESAELDTLLQIRIAHYKNYGNTLIAATLIALAVAACIFSIALRGIIRPLKELEHTMGDLAGGKLDVEVPYAGERGEIGQMARSVEVLRQNGLEKVKLEQQAREAGLKAEEDKKRMMRKLAADFQSNVQGIITAVASAATELYRTAEDMQRTVTGVNEQSGTAAVASAQTSSNVQSVSAAVEEMSASIREIAGQVAKSSTLVNETVAKTQQAEKTTQALSQAVSQISGILQTVQDIAGQINLLALNATIESARAGDAGKGFAVVASEVKSLAGQTSKATEQIAGQIDSVQHASREVVEALAMIQSAITNVNQYASGIAAAVEEQSAATGEISGNMQQASQGVQNIASNIKHITGGASSADHAAREVLNAAQMLSKQSELLNQQVRSFLEGIAA